MTEHRRVSLTTAPVTVGGSSSRSSSRLGKPGQLLPIASSVLDTLQLDMAAAALFNQLHNTGNIIACVGLYYHCRRISLVT